MLRGENASCTSSRSTEVCDALRARIGVIGAGDVVGDKVHQDLQPCLVGTLDEGVQLYLSRVWIFGEVGVDVVVVLDGIG